MLLLFFDLFSWHYSAEKKWIYGDKNAIKSVMTGATVAQQAIKDSGYFDLDTV